MPKLLYFITEDWFFVSHFLPMAEAARECGFEIVVAARSGEQRERLTSKGIRLIPMKSARGSVSLLKILRDFFQCIKIVRSEQPDVVHCISLRPIVIGGLAAKLAGNASLVLAPTGLGHLWIEPGICVALARAIVRIVIGNWLRGPHTHYLFENADDSHDLGIDPDDADVTLVGGAGVDPATITKEPEPPAPPIKVAVVSRFIFPKGIAESVAAIQRARECGANVELHLFGEPDPENPLSVPQDILQQWAAQPGIAWHGRTNDIASVWRDHHIAMLLSYYREGLPRTLVEATAAGRPIVTTDVAGCREVVRNGVEGIIVQPRDIEAAAQAILTLVSDPAARARMGAAAYRRFQERFTAEAVKRTVCSIYTPLRSEAR